MAARGHRLVPIALLLALAACSSPEADRVRGGGPGADPGNTGPVVTMHGGSQPYYATPCLGDPSACAAAPSTTASGPETASRSGSQ